jgi:hypothetical protein
MGAIDRAEGIHYEPIDPQGEESVRLSNRVVRA